LWFAQRSDPLAGFGSAQLLAGINSTDIDYEEWVSRDELTLLFVSTRKEGMGKSDIWKATRARRTDDFSPPTTLVGVNSSARDDRPAVSSDGLTIIFSSDRAGTAGDLDLWLATRSNAQADFSNPTNLSALNSTASDGEPNFSADDRELFFISSRGGSFEIYRAVRACQ
jgi:Tol biopolymer transport system component